MPLGRRTKRKGKDELRWSWVVARATCPLHERLRVGDVVGRRAGGGHKEREGEADEKDGGASHRIGRPPHGRNQCMQCSSVEPGLPVMRREARQWVLLHRHDLHRAVQRHHASGQVPGQVLCNFGKYTVSISNIIHNL